MGAARRIGVTGLAKKGSAGTEYESGIRHQVAAAELVEITDATHAVFIEPLVKGAILIFAANRIIRVGQDNGGPHLDNAFLLGRRRSLRRQMRCKEASA